MLGALLGLSALTLAHGGPAGSPISGLVVEALDGPLQIFRNVHKVVCARPGPTSKADCLNNVLDAIFQFERRAGLVP